MRKLLAVCTALAVCALAVGPAASAQDDDEQVTSERYQRLVRTGNIVDYMRDFQRIADRNGGTRASGLPGHEASADYVADKLRGWGYDVSIQPFEFIFFEERGEPLFERVSPDPRTYTRNEDYITMDYSGSGDVTGDVAIIDTAGDGEGPGCEADDYAGIPQDTSSVALVQRGVCPFGQKASLAEAAGADAVVIYNRADQAGQGPIAGTLGEPVGIPVTGTTLELGQELLGLPQPVTLHLVTDTFSELRQTKNVLADTEEGDRRNKVVVGAHLDSVAEGPGINDNGSGSSGILELARQLDTLGANDRRDGARSLENQVRFAFWGAEESGLVGSTYYVDQLSKSELARHELNLNFDMIGSPNFVRFVYDGDGSAGLSPPGPPGSAAIEQAFLDEFESEDLETEPTAFDGRSDYGPFIAAGVPAGGLFTGAEVVKTPEQEAIYGGTAGDAFDPCYHQACDTIGNLSRTALDQMSDAAAHALFVFAYGEQQATAARSSKAKRAKAKRAGRRSAARMVFRGHAAQR